MWYDESHSYWCIYVGDMIRYLGPQKFKSTVYLISYSASTTEFYLFSAPPIGSGNVILVSLGVLPPTTSWMSKFKGTEVLVRHGSEGMLDACPSPLNSSTCCLIWPLSITLFPFWHKPGPPCSTWFIGAWSILASAAGSLHPHHSSFEAIWF